MPDFLDTCARDLMDTAPQIVQAIRVEMRRGRGTDLTIPQFRTLRFIQRNPSSSLSHLADHLGLTLPGVSRLVDGLVKAGLMIRDESAADRRCLILVLTPAGEEIVNTARAAAQASLAEMLADLSDEDLQLVHRAMSVLQPIFAARLQGMPGA